MKRNMRRKSVSSKETKGVGGEAVEIGHNFAWNLVVRKLDYRTRLRIAQQNQYLAEVVEINAIHELKKYRRHLQDDKYL